MDKPTETSQEDDNTFVIYVPNKINIQDNEKVLNTVLLKLNDERMKVMKLNHESIMSGVKEFIERCIICQKTSDPKNKIRIPLNPLKPSSPLEIGTTDILGPLTTCKNGFKYILAVIDHFTKWIVLYAIKNIDAKTTAKFLFEFICKFGIPTAFFSDQGKNYQAILLEELWELLDIRRLRTSPFHQSVTVYPKD
ncbi:unnamed protein product [Brachionus calyciflorus]|uniref:Integrase catalytic domain-containing protein n=1 Tax=Brachionus calyciflorus TaxID=104777 RepID=A0A814CRU7_9BILA|nr:unnamed protein product [Brachionus calyciflorus]